jgi:hypothetical protein
MRSVEVLVPAAVGGTSQAKKRIGSYPRVHIRGGARAVIFQAGSVLSVRGIGEMLFAPGPVEPFGDEICELFIRDDVSAEIEPLPGERSLENVYWDSECAAENGNEGNRAKCRAKGVFCQCSKLCCPQALAVGRPKGVRGLLYEIVSHMDFSYLSLWVAREEVV